MTSREVGVLTALVRQDDLEEARKDVARAYHSLAALQRHAWSPTQLQLANTDVSVTQTRSLYDTAVLGDTRAAETAGVVRNIGSYAGATGATPEEAREWLHQLVEASGSIDERRAKASPYYPLGQGGAGVRMSSTPTRPPAISPVPRQGRSPQRASMQRTVSPNRRAGSPSRTALRWVPAGSITRTPPRSGQARSPSSSPIRKRPEEAKDWVSSLRQNVSTQSIRQDTVTSTMMRSRRGAESPTRVRVSPSRVRRSPSPKRRSPSPKRLAGNASRVALSSSQLLSTTGRSKGGDLFDDIHVNTVYRGFVDEVELNETLLRLLLNMRGILAAAGVDTQADVVSQVSGALMLLRRQQTMLRERDESIMRLTSMLRMNLGNEDFADQLQTDADTWRARFHSVSALLTIERERGGQGGGDGGASVEVEKSLRMEIESWRTRYSQLEQTASKQPKAIAASSDDSSQRVAEISARLKAVELTASEERTKREQLEKERSSLLERLAVAEARASKDSAGERGTGAEAALAEERMKRERAESERVGLLAKVAAAEAAAAEERAKRERVGSELASTVEELRRLKEGLEEKDAELTARFAEMETARKSHSDLRATLDLARAARHTSETELHKTMAAQSSITAEVSTLKAELDTLRREHATCGALKSDLAAARDEAVSLRRGLAEMDQLRARVSALESERSSLLDQVSILRSKSGVEVRTERSTVVEHETELELTEF